MKSHGRAIVTAGLLGLAACSGPGRRPLSDAAVKIGRPYTVAGVRYVPSDDRTYDEVGWASWYGRQGNRAVTASGERVDARFLSGAHRTLPLPCYVEVTALESGKRIIVRINDRGPFVAGRIIDLSAAAAERLGVRPAGVAPVRVRRVFPDETVRLRLRTGHEAPVLPRLNPVDLAGLRQRLVVGR